MSNSTYLVRMLKSCPHGLTKGQCRLANITSETGRHPDDNYIEIRYGKGKWDWSVYDRSVAQKLCHQPDTDFFAARN